MVVACVAKAGRPVQLGGWLLPCVTHSSTESADPALAHFADRIDEPASCPGASGVGCRPHRYELDDRLGVVRSIRTDETDDAIVDGGEECGAVVAGRAVSGPLGPVLSRVGLFGLVSGAERRW